MGISAIGMMAQIKIYWAYAPGINKTKKKVIIPPQIHILEPN